MVLLCDDVIVLMMMSSVAAAVHDLHLKKVAVTCSFVDLICIFNVQLRSAIKMQVTQHHSSLIYAGVKNNTKCFRTRGP